MKKSILLALAATALLQTALQAQTTQTVDTIVTGDLFEPFGVAIDPGTNAIYIADSANNRIARYTDANGLTTLAGMPGTTGSQDNIGLRARFYSPQGIVLDVDRLIVADSGNHRIRAVTYDGVVTTLAGSTVGLADGTGTAAQFNAPAGLARDTDGNIYIADVLNNAIRKLAPNGAVTTVVSSNLYRPSGVAIGPGGRLYIADSGNNCIKVWENNTLSLIAGRDSRSEYGNVDSPFAEDARFFNPKGVLWRAEEIGLLVSDTGNGLIRRVFYNTNMANWSVETFAVTGPAGASKPVGLTVDTTDSVIIADLGESNIKRLPSSLVTQPPVSAPRLGIIGLETNFFSGLVSADLIEVTNSTFNNDVVIAMLTEGGTEAFYTYAGTRNMRAVPDPDKNSSTPPFWTPGVIGAIGDPIALLVPPSIVDTISPDVSIKAIGMASGRKPSSIVMAQYRFQVANPFIDGDNMAAFSITNYTLGAELYYTTDGTEPTTNSTEYTGGRLSVFNGTTNDVVFRIRGFKEGYHPSSIVNRTFLFKNLKTSTIGLARNYVAGPGGTLIVPVEINLLGGDVLRSLQFRVEVEPDQTGAPVISTNNFRALAIGTNDFVALKVPSTNAPQTRSYVSGNAAGVAVAFVGPQPQFESMNSLLMRESGPIILLAVQIPPDALPSQSYTLRILQPSGTLDGYQDAVMLSTLVDSKIVVLVDSLGYIVGDIAPSDWYNAVDFGNTNLNNSDVNTIFAASLGYRTPFSFSDAFDAMDAFPVDTETSVGGDGSIRYLDWQVILDRSLRLDSNNWRRVYGAQGRYTARATLGNAFADKPAETLDNRGSPLAWFRQAQIVATGVENASPGEQVNVPVSLTPQAGFQLAGLQFRVVVVPEGDAPALTRQAAFVPADGVPTPPWKLDASANDILQAWSLGDFNPNISGQTLLGHLRFTVPENAAAGQCYTIRFHGTDGAPDLNTQYDLESFPACVWVDCAAKRPAECTSDEWKQRFFGGLRHALAQADADPDDDGLCNADEFARGSNPVDLRLHAHGILAGGDTGKDLKLRWFAEQGKRYRIETSPSLAAPSWSTIASGIVGVGNLMEQTVQPASDEARFYRIRNY